MKEREFWIQIRRAFLLIVDAIEIRWDLPRSADFKLHAGAPLRAAMHRRLEPPQSALARSDQNAEERR
jgi:hypothetical protein